MLVYKSNFSVAKVHWLSLQNTTNKKQYQAKLSAPSSSFSACIAMQDRDTLIEQSTTLIEQSQLHFLLKAVCNYLKHYRVV